MSNKGLGLRQTKGKFQIMGKVTGVEKDGFYKEGKSSNTGKSWRRVNFGVMYQPDSVAYVQQTGSQQDYVYFNKSEVVNGKRVSDTQKVAWADRHKAPSEEYNLVGVHCGVEKIVDDDGKIVNNKKTLVAFDACKEISEHLQDDDSVFVKGDIKFSTYNGRHNTSFDFDQVSLCQKPIDFDDEKFKPINMFKQEIIFMGIEKNKENDNEFIVSAKVVNYNSIEDIEMYIQNSKIAQTFKKMLKPYTMIKVGGYISVETLIEEVEVDDAWGVGIEMEKVKAPTVRKLIINGADKDTIDTDTYSEEVIEEALYKQKANDKANSEFKTTSDSDDWGENYEGEEWD